MIKYSIQPPVLVILEEHPIQIFTVTPKQELLVISVKMVHIKLELKISVVQMDSTIMELFVLLLFQPIELIVYK
jgi:hypothetical protein